MKDMLKIQEIPFCPNAYQFESLDRKRMRQEPKLAEFHKWLVSNTANGFITRQETVSMLPPVALDLQPHHKGRFLKLLLCIIYFYSCCLLPFIH